jgi:hypothetical protein
MIMPTTGKRKTTRDQITLLETGRFDLKISTVTYLSAYVGRTEGAHSLQAIMSRTRTMKPMIPPPVID